jgi:hypothetical protein
MSLIAAAAIMGGLNVAKGLWGAGQLIKAKKNINKLLASPVTYKRPEEYAQELGIRQKGLSEDMPGYGLMSDRIGGATAGAYGAAERGSISSNTYGASVGDIYQKSLNAYQDLMMQSSDFKQKQKEKYIDTLRQGAGYSEDELQWKQTQWDIAMNQAQEDKQTGATSLWSGLEGAAGALSNYAGTKYAGDIMKGLQQTGTGMGTAGQNLQVSPIKFGNDWQNWYKPGFQMPKYK